MNKDGAKSQSAFLNNKETTTGNFEKDKELVSEDSNELGSIYKAIVNISSKLEELAKENEFLKKEIKENREKENKLINRFSWLLIILDISATLLMIMAVILFINSFYPFIKGLMADDVGATIVIGFIGTAISGSILAVWGVFNKYFKLVLEREKLISK